MFRLTCNDFENNVFKAFKDLLIEEEYLDVTLASDGDKQIKAHKLILSAFSPVFKNLLRKNPHPHPLILLKGLSPEDLDYMMKFIYIGEVEVPQDDLQRFLEVAEDFQIKGLSNNFSTNKRGRKTFGDQFQPKESLLVEDFRIKDLSNNFSRNKRGNKTLGDQFQPEETVEDFQIKDLSNTFSRNRGGRKTLRDQFQPEDIVMAKSPRRIQLLSEMLLEDQDDVFNDTSIEDKVNSGEIYPCDIDHVKTKTDTIEAKEPKDQTKNEVLLYSCEDCSFEATTNLALQQHRFANHSVRI